MVHRATKTTLSALGIAGALTFASAAPANATLLIAADIGGTLFCAADNNVGCGDASYTVLQDLDPAAGSLLLPNGNLGGLDIQGSVHTATVGSGAGGLNILNSSSLTVANNTDATITGTVAVGATDFAGPVTSALTTSSGTFVNAIGSSIDMTWWNDPANGQGGESPTDTPGVLIDSFSTTATTLATSLAHDGGPFPINDPELFSMTMGFTFDLVAGGQLISRGQSEIKEQEAVPEPFMVSLMGIGLVAVGRRLRRRH